MNQAKSCKNKFSDLKLGCVEKDQKISFEKQENDISSNDSEEVWRFHAVQGLPFLTDDIQRKKQKFQNNTLLSAVIKKAIFI